jgi:hypothetical protein
VNTTFNHTTPPDLLDDIDPEADAWAGQPDSFFDLARRLAAEDRAEEAVQDDQAGQRSELVAFGEV